MTNDKLTCTYLIVDGAVGYLKIKNNSWSLDSTDMKILAALQENSRQTYAAIGKRIGLAHSTVYDRIRRMERQKVIRDYTVLVDLEKVGVKNITAMMTVYTDPKEAERVAEKLAKCAQVLEAYTSLSDELVVMAKVVAVNQEELHSFVANFVAPLAGVLRIRTSIVSRKLKETHFLIADYSKGLHL